jgi:hypothetical protein
MKNIFKYFAVCAVLVGMVSCDDDEQNVTDLVQETVERGAVLRTTATFSNEFPIGDTDALFSVEIEEQDVEGGDLLESVDVYITYKDGSPDAGDSSGGIFDEVFARNIPASEFSPGPFGLPRTTLTISFAEMLALVNLTDDQTFGGDSFTTRLALNLTDGRVFSTDNAGGIITGGFFNSPFQYITPVVCPVGEEEFVGDYTITNDTTGVLGFNVFAEGATVTLYIPEEATSVDRAFDYQYLPDAGVGQDPVDFEIQFVCNNVIVPDGQNTGLQCSSGLTVGPAPDGSFGSYTTGDDSTFTIRFTDNTGSDCGEGPLNVQATLTKQ